MHAEEAEQKRLEDQVAQLKSKIDALQAKLDGLRQHTEPDQK